MIGIGTNTPSKKLDLHSTLKTNKFDKFIINAFTWYLKKGEYTLFITSKKNEINPSEKLIIWKDGNVGIGI